MKKTRKRYSAEFKAQVIELIEAGRPVPEIAADFEIDPSCLYAWRRKAAHSQPTQIGSGGLRAVGEEDVADELRRLRRENADLKLDNDILKKAAVILGTKPQPNAAR